MIYTYYLIFGNIEKNIFDIFKLLLSKKIKKVLKFYEYKTIVNYVLIKETNLL